MKNILSLYLLQCQIVNVKRTDARDPRTRSSYKLQLLRDNVLRASRVRMIFTIVLAFATGISICPRLTNRFRGQLVALDLRTRSSYKLQLRRNNVLRASACSNDIYDCLSIRDGYLDLPATYESLQGATRSPRPSN